MCYSAGLGTCFCQDCGVYGGMGLFHFLQAAPGAQSPCPQESSLWPQKALLPCLGVSEHFPGFNVVSNTTADTLPENVPQDSTQCVGLVSGQFCCHFYFLLAELHEAF